MAVEQYEVDMGVGYKHTNGRTLEIAGEQRAGEWFCSEADSDGDGEWFCSEANSVDCYASGTYERDGDVDVITDNDGNELARLTTEDDFAAWAETMLA